MKKTKATDVLLWAVSLIITISIILLMQGCCDKTFIPSPYEVKVPVKCTPPIVDKPIIKNSASENLLEILRYASDLENSLEVCK